MSNTNMETGVVVIGRNEGERLKACLSAIQGLDVVYVDSGSSDGSIEFAQSLGVKCVELDLTSPFTAARARNEGFEALLRDFPYLKYVMFVDGDCVIADSWIQSAVEFMRANLEVAVVCGRRKERFPDASIYNAFCDIEWNTPVGKAKACGGDAVYRIEVFKLVNGFDPTFIAGEEPELCFRIRAAGYFIERLDLLMTLHDAAMTRFSQWWRRSERSGYAYYLNYKKHGKSKEGFRKKEVRSIVVWTGIFAVSIILAVTIKSVLPIIGYFILGFIQVLRVERGLERVKGEFTPSVCKAYATSVVMAKFPQFIGIFKGFYKSTMSKQHTLLEYK